jgi:hypothetical protein
MADFHATWERPAEHVNQGRSGAAAKVTTPERVATLAEAAETRRQANKKLRAPALRRNAAG